MRDVPGAEVKVHALLAALRARETDEVAQRWVALIRGAYAAPQVSGGMRGWVSANNRKQIESLQAMFDKHDRVDRLVYPGPRTMVFNPFGVKFHAEDKPVIDHRFNRIRSVAQSEDTFVGYSANYLRVLVYHRVDEPQKV
jgi:hypothetical protein